jgi:PAS domain S-box-containing protein
MSDAGKARSQRISGHDPSHDGTPTPDRDGSGNETLHGLPEISETKYRDLVEHSPEPLAVQQSGKWVFMNSAGMQLFGAISLKEIIGESVLRFASPDQHRHIKTHLCRRITAGHPSSLIEARLLRLDGTSFVAELTAMPIHYQDGKAAIIIARDITERKRAEQLLREENRVLEMLSSGHSLSDVLKALNLMIESQFPGMRSSVLLLDDAGKHLHTGSAPNLPESYNKALNGVAIGPRVGSCGTAAYRDETVIVKDIASDPLWANYRELACKHGLRACWSMPIHSSHDKVLGTFALYSDKPASPTPKELDLIATAAHIAGIAIEHHQAEDELRRHRDQLEAMVQKRTRELAAARDKAEAASHAKSAFLANMSHELRTPLNSIIGFSEMMHEGLAGSLSTQQKNYIHDILASARHLLALINDILDLSKIEAGRMEIDLNEFNVETFLQGIVFFAREEALKRKIRLATDIEKDIGCITADERRIRQVLYNLISNAMKFTPEGGSVCISARRARDAGPAANGKAGSTPGTTDAIEISVSDTGIGISREDMKRLFRPFQQLDLPLSKRFEGTGLGLNLSHRIIELHGGRIWADSRPGKGSKFTFILPRKAKPRQPDLHLHDMIDPVTHLFTWRHALNYLDSIISFHKRHGLGFCFLEMAMNPGASSADCIRLAGILRKASRKHEIIIQGKETFTFCLVMFAIRDEEEVDRTVTRFRKRLAEADLAVTFKKTIYPQDGTSVDELLERLSD